MCARFASGWAELLRGLSNSPQNDTKRVFSLLSFHTYSSRSASVKCIHEIDPFEFPN